MVLRWPFTYPVVDFLLERSAVQSALGQLGCHTHDNLVNITRARQQFLEYNSENGSRVLLRYNRSL